MSTATALDWFRELLWVSVLAAGPTILAVVIVGLIISIIQAATQVSDQSVAFAPKALAAIVALVVAGPWMMTQMAQFTTAAITAMGGMHP